MNTLLRWIIVLMGGLLCGITLKAQVFPVSSNTVVIPPHPLFLNEYSSVGSNFLQGTVVLNDFQSPTRNVKLQITIEGEDVRLQTKATYIPPAPISLSPGVPVVLSGADFAGYLSTNNLNLQGITAAEINTNGGKLPEGIYNFCIDVLDFQSSAKVAQTSCMQAFLQQVQPPFTLTPTCEEVITPLNPQNVLFTWQQAGGAPADVIINTQYKLQVYEATAGVTDPQAAVNNNQAMLIYESAPLMQPSLNMDLTTTQLKTGKTYVYRVQAIDATGKDVYANDGFSEFCWFYYGYPTDGILGINAPENGKIFRKGDQRVFAWTNSDKSVIGQAFSYDIKLVKITGTQTAESALKNNRAVYTASVPAFTSTQGANHIMREDLEPDADYAWQVVAITEEQQVAKSEIYTFATAPLLEYFYAGNFKIAVTKLSNSSASNLSGVGLIPISDDTSKVFEVAFEGLELNEISGKYYLAKGEATFDIAGVDALTLAPEIEANGPAEFLFEKGKMSKAGVQVGGKFQWQLPHPVMSGEKALLTSELTWLSLKQSNSKYDGIAKLKEDKVYELMDPMNHEMVIDEASDIVIADNTYQLRLNGDVKLPERIATTDGNKFVVPFTEAKQLSYFEITPQSAARSFSPIANASFTVSPSKIIIDFSETQSPERFSANGGWKGVYFPNYRIAIPSNFDPTQQITSAYDYQDDIEQAGDNEFWTTGKGIHFKYEYTLVNTSENPVKFNSFKTEEVALVVDVEENRIQDGSGMRGIINIPFFDADTDYPYLININNEDGILEGYLTDDLTDLRVVQSPSGGENRMEITVKRAEFKANNRLDCVVDIKIPALGADIIGVREFSVYGNNFIGFGTGVNNAITLDQEATGYYDPFDVTITELGAAFTGASYALSYKMRANLGEGISGPEGPPTFAVHSVEEADPSLLPPGSGAVPKPDIELPENAGQSETLQVSKTEIEFDNAVVYMKGSLSLASHPWGKVFEGSIFGELKVPAQIEMGAKVIVGVKDNNDFWYFDAFFNDKSGRGINVMNKVGITALEGRVYHNMKKLDGEFVVDPSVHLGAALYIQLLDYPGGGRLFTADGALEVLVSEDNFTLNLRGDIAVMTDMSRMGVGGSVGKQVAQEVGEEVIEEVMDQLGPLELDIPIGGGTFGVKAESLTKGGTSFQKGSLFIGMDADFTDVPSFNSTLRANGYSFGMGGSTSGSLNFNANLNGPTVGLNFNGTNAGSFNLDVEGVAIATGFDVAKKSGNFNFAYDESLVELGVNATDKTGDILFQLDANRSLTANKTATGASLGFLYDNTNLSLAADGAAQTAEAILSTNGISMRTFADKKSKAASFGYEMSGFKLGISGAAAGVGSFLVESGNTTFTADANIPNKTGSLSYADGENTLLAELLANGTGKLSVEAGGTAFGISGDNAGTQGGVYFSNNETQFALNANRETATGDLLLNFDGNEVAGLVDTDTLFAKFSNGTTLLEVGGNYNNSGSLRLRNGDKEVAIAGNATTKAGSLLLDDGTNRLFVAADPQNSLGQLEINYAGNIVNAGRNGDQANIFFDIQGYQLKALGGLDGVGEISLQTPEISIGQYVNAPEQAAGLELAFDETTFKLEASNTAKTASLNYSDGNTSFFSDLTAEEAELKFATGALELGAKGNKTGAGSLSYSDGDRQFGISQNPIEKSGSFFINEGSFGLTAAANATAKTGEIKYIDGNREIAASLGETSAFGYKDGNLALSASGSVNGDVALSYTSDQVFNITGNVLSKTAEMSYADADYTVTAAANNTSKSGSVSLTENNRSYGLNVGETGNNFSFSDGTHSVAANLAGSQLEVTYGIGENTIGIAAAPDGGSISYQLADAKISMNTDGVLTASQGGRTISIEPSLSGGKPTMKDGASTVTYAVDNRGRASKTFNVSSGKVTMAVDNGTTSVSYANGGSEVVLSRTGNSASGTYDNGSEKYEVSKTGDTYAVGYNDLQISANPNEVNAAYGKNSVSISKNGGAVKYENVAVAANTTDGISYNDGTYASSISPAGFSIAKDGQVVEVGTDQSFKLQYANDKYITLKDKNLALAYEDVNLNIPPDYLLSFNSEYFNFDMRDPQLELNYEGKQLAIAENVFRLQTSPEELLEYNNGNLTGKYDGLDVSLDKEMNIAFSKDEYNFNLKPSQEIELGVGEKVVRLKKDEMFVQYDADKKLSLTPTALAFNYDDKEVTFSSDKALAYADSDRAYNLSANGLSINEGDYNLAFDSETFELGYAKDKYIKLGKGKLEAGYDKVLAKFDAAESLSFTDGERSFELGKTGLSVQEGDVSLSVLAQEGETGIRMVTADNNFTLTPKELDINWDDYHFTVDENKVFEADVVGTKITAGKAGVTLASNGVDVAFFTENDLIHTSYRGDVLALSKDQVLRFSHDKYLVQLQESFGSLGATLTDGTRTIGLNHGDQLFSFDQDGFSLGASGDVRKSIDLTVKAGEFAGGVSLAKDDFVRFTGGGSSFGALNFDVGSNKNLGATITNAGREVGLKYEKGAINFYDSEMEPPNADEAKLEGSAAVPAQDGPQYLTEKITDESGGRLKGMVEIYFNAKEEHLIANAAVASSSFQGIPIPPCMNGALACEFRKNEWSIRVGTEQQRIELFPSCSGFGGGGWLYLDHTSKLEVGVFAGFKAGGTASFSAMGCDVDLTAQVSAEILAKASLVLSPFKLKSAAIALDINGKLALAYACDWGPNADITIAELALYGVLQANFYDDGTQIKGDMGGYINVLDIFEADFDAGFDVKL